MDYSHCNCVTSRIKVLGWLKKESKKISNSGFRLFQVGHLRIVSAGHSYSDTVDWGSIHRQV